MHRCKKIAILFSAVILGVGFAAAADELVLERSFELGSGSTLEFDSDQGGITITGESRGDIQVRVLARDMDPEDAREALTLDFDEGVDRLEVRARIRKAGWVDSLFGKGGGGIFFEVQVPLDTRLLIDNGSGGVRVSDIDAGVTIDNGSGGIQVTRIRGEVNVDNGSGGIKVTEIDGEVIIDNGSGGVRVEEVRGELNIDNGSGGVNVQDISGDVIVDNGSGGVSLDGLEGGLSVETSSGGIRARLTGPNAGVHAETGSGGVRIEVPAGWGAELDLSSRKGDVVVRGWREVSVGDARSFQGSVGGGGAKITMHSDSGDVELIAN